MKMPTCKEIVEASQDSMGWCTNCEFFTRDCTEPDAHDYDCPECGENSVVGAEELLFM